MVRWPRRVPLARLPTPIRPLPRLSEELGIELFVKRDDLTGVALSGNKVRKLEFLFREALDRGARTVMTCGGVQSNHARATAVAAASLGLSSHLFLRGDPPERAEGNVLLDRLVGAEITYITPEQYRDVSGLMAAAAERESPAAYPIPEGGSNGLGALGYARAVGEIIEAEEDLGLPFDAVVHALGSGGTSAGLVLGKEAFGLGAELVAVNICDDEPYFRDVVGRILDEARERFAPDASASVDDLTILDGHTGPGYALNTPEDLATLRRIARSEGLLLDPVYTGKAFHGMLEELSNRLAGHRRILFLHTGGIFGLFPCAEELLSG
ncbi:MAG: 1-aminocyclopropane-1-carboxylate deaminase/D-cysteine desulfhydrase [Planctomycetota bacterium]|jgi:D-cysteine desulfhydrase